MSTDRELLEFAAKAAGLDVRFDITEQPMSIDLAGTGRYWNPLRDDGDALRLAVKLGIEYGFGWNNDGTIQRIIIDDELHIIVENNDPCAATRFAITRAAAEIGKAKEDK